MLRFALNQPKALGDFEDAWTGQMVSESDNVIANLVAEGLDPAYSGMPATVVGPSAPASGGFFSSLFSALTAKPVVNAALNKYVFGATSPIPTATNVPYQYKTAGQWIAGIPNSYVMLGGAAIALIALSKKRR